MLILVLIMTWPSQWYSQYSAMDWGAMEASASYEGTSSGELAAKAIAMYGIGEAGSVEAALEAVTADAADYRGWTALALVNMSQDTAYMDSVFSTAFSLAPANDPILWEVHAYWLLSIGDTQAAVESASNAISADSMFAPGWLTLSMALIDQGLYQEALGVAEDALNTQPDCIQLIHQLAQAQESAGFTENAVQTYREVIARDPSRISAYTDLGILLEQTKRDGEAVKVYRDVLEIAPDYAWAWGELAALELDMGRPALADSFFSRSIELDPNDSWALYRLGRLRSSSDPESALSLLRRAVDISPDYSSAWQELVFLYESMDDMASAEAALRKCIDIEPEAWLYGELGWVLENRGNYQEAEVAYQAGVELDSQYLYGWQRRGDLFIRDGDFASAENWFSEAMDVLEEDDPWIMKNLGRLYASRGDFETALVLFRDAIALDQYDNTIWIDLARADFALGNHREALEFLDSCLVAGGDSVAAYAERIAILNDLGEDTYDLLSATLIRWPDLWIRAGWSALDSRLHQRALEYALVSKAQETLDEMQLISLAELFNELEMPGERMECYLEAAAFDTLDIDAASSIANFFFQQDMYQSSIELLTREYNRREWNPEITTALAEAYLFNDQLDEAEILLNEVIADDPYSVYAICYLGLIAENRGNPEEAADKYLLALRLEPGYSYAEDRLVFISSEQYDPARRRRTSRQLEWSLWLDLSSTGGNVEEQNLGGGGSLTYKYGSDGSSVEFETSGRAEIRDGKDLRRTAWASLSAEHFITDHLYVGASSSWDRQPLTVRPWQLSSYLAAGWKSWPADWIWLAPETGAGLVSTRWSTSEDRTDEWTVYTSLSLWAKTNVNWLPSLWLSGNLYIPPEETTGLVANAVGELEFSLPGPLSLILGTSVDYTRTPVVESWEKLDSEIYLRLRL